MDREIRPYQKKHTIVSLYNQPNAERLFHISIYGKAQRCSGAISVFYSCRLLFPLACPPLRIRLLCAFFLCLLESELFSFAAFLSTCLLPLDLPTMIMLLRKIIYKYILGRRILNETAVHEEGYSA